MRLGHSASMRGIRSNHASFPHVGKIDHLLFHLILYRVLPFRILAALSPAFVIHIPSLSILDATLIIVIVSKQKAFALHASLLIR